MVLLEQTTCKQLSVPNMEKFRHYFLRDIFLHPHENFRLSNYIEKETK